MGRANRTAKALLGRGLDRHRARAQRSGATRVHGVHRFAAHGSTGGRSMNTQARQLNPQKDPGQQAFSNEQEKQ